MHSTLLDAVDDEEDEVERIYEAEGDGDASIPRVADLPPPL